MPFFLEYATLNGAGRFAVEGTSISDAIARASGALHGLDCTGAAFRHTTDSDPAFGEGSLLAAYTPETGWKIQETRQE